MFIKLPMHIYVASVLLGVVGAERIHRRAFWSPEPEKLSAWLDAEKFAQVIKIFNKYVQPATQVWGYEVNNHLGCPAPPRKTAAAERPSPDVGLDALSAHIGVENCATRPVPYCRFPPEEVRQLFRSTSDDELKRAVLNADAQLVQELENGQAPDPDAAKQWWVVDLYADWCPHCQAFAPTYLSTAVKLMEKHGELNVRFAAVDCEIHSEFCAARALHGFPTVLTIPPYGGAPETRTHDGEHFWDALSEIVGGPLAETLRQADASNGLGRGNDKCPSKRELGSSAPVDSIPLGVGWRKAEADFAPQDRLHDAARMVHYVLRNWVRPQSVGEAIFMPPWTKAKNDLPGFYAAAEIKAKKKHARANKKTKFKIPLQWEVPFQPYAFTYNTLIGLEQWLQALVKALPVSPDAQKSLEWLRDMLRERIEKAEQHGVGLCLVEWLQWLDSEWFDSFALGHPVENEPITCTTETCALWTTFHILSVNAPEGEHLDIMAGIVAFVEHFFRCAHCRAHFLHQYNNQKAYGSRNIKSADDLIKVLWRFHAAVSIRVQHENKCLADRQWPPVDFCPACWRARELSEKPWTAWEEVMKIYPFTIDWSHAEGQQVLPNDDVVLAFLKDTYKIS